jgi:hypothetical protein
VSFEAKFDSPCQNCDTEIKVGNRIQFAKITGVEHVACPPEIIPMICSKCFMALSVTGACACF